MQSESPSHTDQLQMQDNTSQERKGTPMALEVWAKQNPEPKQNTQIVQQIQEIVEHCNQSAVSSTGRTKKFSVGDKRLKLESEDKLTN